MSEHTEQDGAPLDLESIKVRWKNGEYHNREDFGSTNPLLSAEAAVEALIAEVERLREALASRSPETDIDRALLETLTRSKSPCGHFGAYAVTADGGKLVTCLQCRAEKAEAESASRSSAPTPTEGWQPIETAPKDGTMILVAEPSPPIQRHRIVVWWVHRWLTVPGRITVRPTHWMPLPRPPALSGPSPAPKEETS